MENRFTYNPPGTNELKKIILLRNEVKSIARLILDNCPESRETSLAITKLEEVLMWANKSILKNG